VLPLICGGIALASLALGQQQAPPPPVTAGPISGDWTIHFHAGHQTASGDLHLHADGEQLTGTVETPHTGPGTVQNGKWTNQKLEATLVFERHESVVLKGELNTDGILTGNYTTEGRTETWQAERKTAAESSSKPG
ncbi:MAG: hypothetical protein ACJ8M1_00005, partial [Chthoniobacterales bacterium]